MKTKISGQRKVEEALNRGEVLTPALIKSRYKLKNPYQQVYYIETVLGCNVKRETFIRKNGQRSVKYSI